MKNFGFTLSEVLITVGIIGVVAAITIPTLIHKVKTYELRVQLKKTYSDLNQISKRFYNDYGITISEFTERADRNSNYTASLSGNWSTFVHKIFPTYLASLTNSGKVTTNQFEIQKVHTIRTMAGKITTNVCDNSGFKVDSSGRMYIFNDSPYPNENGPIVCVDINGLGGPNRYGYDFFIFIFTTKGTVIPMGQPDENNTTDTRWQYNFSRTGKEYCNPNGSFETQTACAYYAIKNINPYNEDQNYWDSFLK